MGLLNRIRRFQTERKLRSLGKDLAAEVRVAKAPDQASGLSVGPPVPPRFFVGGSDSCVACGGYFRLDKLNPVWRVTALYFSDTGRVDIPFTDAALYCERCEPPAPIVFILREADMEENADERYFRIQDGFFQDVDENNGENRYTVSLEEYAHTFCSECGELIEETTCQRHRTPKRTRQR